MPGRSGGVERGATRVADRPGHDMRYAINAGRAGRERYSPRETFESGFAKTVDWYLGNQPWIEAITDGSYRNWIESNYRSR